MRVLGHVRSSGSQEHWATAITGHGHELIADEPLPAGLDAGFRPFDLLLAGLSACTNITLRMYADRKSWPLDEVGVECTFVRDDDGDEAADRISRVLTLRGDLDDEQRARLADIAERTPVTLVVKRGTPVTTTLAG
jgi:putative redox protein